MDGSWEYHAKRNKSDRKGPEPYDFTDTCYIKQKATRVQTHRHRQQKGSYQRGSEGEDEKGKGGQIHGVRERLDFEWWAQCSTQMMYYKNTWNI